MKETRKDFNYLFEKYANKYVRYEKALADFIIEKGLKLIVETGAGVSTLHILKALEKTGGRLFSIDPNPHCGYEIDHPQYRLIKKRSVAAMKELYTETGPWDLFLHDSDHDVFCQTYEYYLGFGLIREGGYIASDDTEWNGHFSWKHFIEQKGLEEITLVDLKLAQKRHLYDVGKDRADRYEHDAYKLATAAENEWLSSGHQNTFHLVYPDRKR